MGRAATELSDLTIVTSDNPRTEEPQEIIGQIEAGIAVPKFSDVAAWNRQRDRGYVVIPDRREAIVAALALAESRDIVLIAGKGHEDYQIIGTRKFPFDDRLIAREALQRLQDEGGKR